MEKEDIENMAKKIYKNEYDAILSENAKLRKEVEILQDDLKHCRNHCDWLRAQFETERNKLREAITKLQIALDNISILAASPEQVKHDIATVGCIVSAYGRTYDEKLVVEQMRALKKERDMLRKERDMISDMLQKERDMIADMLQRERDMISDMLPKEKE